MSGKRTVALSADQIDFIQTSVDYSARNVRETDYGQTPELLAFGAKRQDEVEAMIAGIRAAFREVEVRPGSD